MIQPTAFVVHDPSFETVLGSDPQLIEVIATDAHEGLVYAPVEDALYFTTLPRFSTTPANCGPLVAIKRLALDGKRFPIGPERLSTIEVEVHAANGMCLDHHGHLVVCEQGDVTHHGRISRVDPTSGAVDTIVDEWAGLRLNSPNDVVVKSDGTIWFTDPSYGYLQGFKDVAEIGDFVYRYDPATGRMSVVADSFVKPNGLAFSPDETTLYITDSGANQAPGSYHVHLPHHVIAFDVSDGRRLTNSRLFAVTSPGFPDGIKVDDVGRVFASSSAGVQIFDTVGELIGEIHLPGTVNFTFGGVDRDVLFIATDTAIWAAITTARGPRLPLAAAQGVQPCP